MTVDLEYRYQRVAVTGGAAEDIAGATAATYTRTAADDGYRIRAGVRVVGTTEWTWTPLSDLVPITVGAELAVVWDLTTTSTVGANLGVVWHTTTTVGRSLAARWNVAEATSTELAADTFDRADSTTGLGTSSSGHAWASLHGPTRNHGIAGNAAYYADAPATGETVDVVDAGNRNVTVRGDVTLGATGDSDIGFALRAVDNNSFILCGLGLDATDNKLAAYVLDNGTYRIIGEWSPAGLVAGTTYELEVTINGTAFTAKLDGTTRLTGTLTATQDTATTGVGDTRHGLRSNGDSGNSRVDNLVILEPVP